MNDHPMSQFLELYPPEPDPDRDNDIPETRVSPRSPRKMPVQGRIDLHGYTVDEARSELDRFLKEAVSQGKRKVLVIHGKGLHSEGDSRLRDMSKQMLAEHQLVGTTGTADPRDGGSGATWAILRHRSR